MKRLKKVLIFIASVAVIGAAGLYLWFRHSVPSYSGEVHLSILDQGVEIWFDEFGIPHIKAQRKTDLYKAFGYVHASERLFQMEMLRRAGGGQLAEITGPALLSTDIMFKSLGLSEYADQSDSLLHASGDEAILEEIQAYLAGVNHYLLNGPKPIEFSLMGIPVNEFTTRDLFLISGAMSYSFSQAQKTEPVTDFIARNFGNDYLREIGLWHGKEESFIPSDIHPTGMLKYAQAAMNVEQALPVSPLLGSNAWAVAGIRTKSGKPLFCNDTHIGYLLPQTWYEAYLECPDFEMYGHFLAGVPYALVGRNRDISWGVTMLLNDDMDFYREEFDSADSMLVKYRGQWKRATSRYYDIAVKGEEPHHFHVRVTPHGPVVNDAFPAMRREVPISVFWTYTAVENRTVNAFRGMNNARNRSEFESNLPDIHAPGLNINYADATGEIAWWACAKLIQRPDHVNSWTILDGASGEDEVLGYYPFEKNPRLINPRSGFIASANEWPAPADSLFYPGYYTPNFRGNRIRKLLSERSDWDAEGMKELLNDAVNEADHSAWRTMLLNLQRNSGFSPSDEDRELLRSLSEWDGQYRPESVAATVFTRMLFHFLRESCEDELGSELFDVFMATHQVRRAYSVLLESDSSRWFDNKLTPEVTETRDSIVERAFRSAMSELRETFGENWKLWSWGKLCSLELRHPLGSVGLLRPLFNIGPKPVTGGNETIRQAGFTMKRSLVSEVYFGSQMRIVTDFSDDVKCSNITPAGQSGHRASPHYKDQHELYRNGQFRPQHFGMSTEGISVRRMQFLP